MTKNIEELSLVKKVDENISTDGIMDIKVGIYNLFVNLINHLVVYEGPEQAVKSALEYLEEISINFNSAIETKE